MAKTDRGARRQRRWKLIRAAVRSGIRRYPRELLKSLREGRRRAAEPLTASLAHIEHSDIAVAWLGHGSVLARLAGCNVLIDPVFSDRIGKQVGRLTLGPRRLVAAPVAPAGLPPIDLVLITHAHFDHLDRPSLRQLARKETVVLTSRRTRRLIPPGFGAVRELEPGAALDVGSLRVRALTPAHWGARNVIDRHRKPNSYLVESPAGRIVFAGDTAYTDAFAQTNRIDLAVFGIGAYDPWEHAHATPEQVWAMFVGMDAKWLLPIHHSTFELSDEPVDEPLRRLLAAADGYAGRIVQVDPGELWVAPRCPRLPAHEPARAG